MICVEMQVPANANVEEELVARAAAGDIRALARGISFLEDGASCSAEIVAACERMGRKSRRVGVTGSAGAGKSTLVDQMVRCLRARGERIAVVAIDPTSPFTGGALLGDRIRMQGFSGDSDVFIRSMASRGEAGGVAKAAESVCMLLEAAGFGMVIVETVGVGQGEISVTGLVDVTLLVLVPGAGDDVQSLKAGIMEAADVFVINKADQAGAAKVQAEVMAMQSLSGQTRPVLKTNALTGEGVRELVALIGGDMTGERRRMQKSLQAKLDHIGIAVRSISATRGFYERLATDSTREEEIESEQVRTAMIPVGDAQIELLEATEENSVIGRFTARRGEGLHHVALRVEDIDEQFRKMKAAGVRMVSESVRRGAGGHRYFFVHPASTGGVLMELVGD